MFCRSPDRSGQRCQDLPAPAEDGGDAELLSLSRWSLSPEDACAAALLRGKWARQKVPDIIVTAIDGDGRVIARRACILVAALRDESPAGLHLDVQASLHGAHLHVLVQVAVHVALCRGQLQLEGNSRDFLVSFQDTRSVLPLESFLETRRDFATLDVLFSGKSFIWQNAIERKTNPASTAQSLVSSKQLAMNSTAIHVARQYNDTHTSTFFIL